MNTPEQTAIAWLINANNWLNNFDDKSALSDPAKLLLNKLKQVRENNESKSAWDIINDLRRLSDKSEEKEYAEIRLRCGLVAAEMGNFKDALRLFNEASSKYTRFQHHHAVAIWMIGCVQWLLPDKEVEAINSWRSSLRIFENLRDDLLKNERQRNTNKSQKDIYAWYEGRCKDMNRALHLATQKYGIPVLPPYDDLSYEVSDTVSQEKPGTELDYGNTEMHCLEIFPVYEHIKAGDLGPSGILSESTGHLEIDRVFINGRPHRIVSINGTHVTRILATSSSVVIKVSGDSMNKAKILDGDYILLRLLPKNISDFDATGMLPEDDNFYTDVGHSQVVKDGDIVAAEILDEDNKVTLKRIFRHGRKIILQPDSTNPKYQTREFDGMNKDFYVRGVVTAVFKPL